MEPFTLYVYRVMGWSIPGAEQLMVKRFILLLIYMMCIALCTHLDHFYTKFCLIQVDWDSSMIKRINQRIYGVALDLFVIPGGVHCRLIAQTSV